MGKWYVGTILAVVALTALVLHLYYPPLQPVWEYKHTDTYVSGNKYNTYYEFSYQSGYVKTDYSTDFDGDGKNETQSPSYSYYTNSSQASNAWESAFAFNDPAEKGGRPTLIKTFTNAYYMVLTALVLTLISVFLYPLAGYGKLSPGAPKALAGIAAVLLISSSLYLVFSVPSAIEQDDITREKYEYLQDHPNLVGFKHEAGNGTNFYWGQSYVDQLDPPLQRQDAQWGAGYGWWLNLVVFFLLVISTAFADPTAKPQKKKGKTRPCPKCGKPMRYVSQYSEWYCDSCRAYLDEIMEEIAPKKTAPAQVQQRRPEPPPPSVPKDDDDMLEW